MSKRLTKTIILIVFVVFLGIKNVDARTAKSCVYQLGNDYKIIEIDSTGNSVSMEVESWLAEGHLTEPGDEFLGFDLNKGTDNFIVNWIEKSKGFSGLTYYGNNNQKCPPFLVQIDYSLAGNQYYFADSSSLQSIEGIGDSSSTYKLVAELIGNSYGTVPVDTSVKQITAKTCKCSGRDNNTNISFTIKVGNGLNNSSVSAGPASSKILNWDKISHMDFLLPDSFDFDLGVMYFASDQYYTYIGDLVNNDSCPAYGIAVNSTLSDGVYLSDEASLETLKKDIADAYIGEKIYVVPCSIVEESNSSNSNSTSNKPDKEYDDPEINMNGDPLSNDLTTYKCGLNDDGEAMMVGIPHNIPRIVRFIYNFLQFLVPLAIIILGSIDLLKAVAAQKEDDIKQGYQTLIKRLIGAVIVFFVFAIVKLLISLVSDSSDGILDCAECFLKNDENCIAE